MLPAICWANIVDRADLETSRIQVNNLFAETK